MRMVDANIQGNEIHKPEFGRLIRQFKLYKLLFFILPFLSAINAYSQLDATFTQQKDACDGLNNGSIDVTVTGSTGAILVTFFGPPNYNITPTDGITETVSGLNPRMYVVVVQDAVDTKVFNVDILDVVAPLTAAVNSTSDNTDCTNPNGSITINVGGGTGSYTFEWTGPNGFTYNLQNPPPTLEGGDYFVDVFDAGTNCFRTLGPITLANPVVANQNITTVSPLIACPSVGAVVDLNGSELGKTYEILVNGVASGFTSPGTGGAISITLPSGNFNDADILTVEGFEGVCPRVFMTGFVLVFVSTESVAPTAAIVDNPNYCDDAMPANIVLSFTGGSLGTGATAEWYDDPALTNNIGSGNDLSIPAPNVTTTYYVRFEGTCNTTVDESVTVLVDNASIAPTGANVDNPNYCNDAAPVNILLTYVGGTPGTGAIAQWYDDAAFTSNVGSGNNLPLAAPLTTTTYFVRFEGICGNTIAQNVTVTVDLASVAPTAASVDNANYCDDAMPANIVLTFSGGSLGTGATAEWYDDAGFTSNVGSGNNLTLAAPNVTTTYFVRFEGICNTTADQSVTVTVDNASIAPTSASVDIATYCNDAAPANITLSFAGGSLGTGATAEWYDDAGFTSSVGSGNNLIIGAPLTTTTYFIRFEGICGNTAAQNVVVTVDLASVAPTAASVDNGNYCDDAMPANIVLTFSGGSLGTGATAEWYDDAGFTSNVGSGNNLTLAAPNTTTTYFVRFEGTCNTTADQSVTVTVDNASTAPTSASVDVATYCDDAAPVNITLSYGGGSLGTGATAEWYDDAGFTSNIGSGNNLSLAAPNITTTYFIRFEGTCNITATQSVTVTVDNASVAPTAASVDNANYCDNAMPANIILSFSGGSLGTGATAEWYDDAGFTSNVGSGNNLTLAAPNVTSTYFVRFEGACNTTADQSVTVTVDNASIAPTSASVDLATYCDNAAPVNIILSFAGGTLGTGASAEWYDDAGLTNNVGSGNNLSLAAPNTTTTYFIRFEGTCNITSNQSVTVTVDNASVAPTAASVDNANYCDNALPANIILSFSGGSLGTGATAEWYDDAGFTSNVGSGNNLTLAAPNTTTTYFVRFEGACNTTADQSVTVTVDNASTAPTSASVDITTYCDDVAPVNIILSFAGGTLGTSATAEWYDDAGFTSNVGSGNNLSLAAPNTTTTYFVRFEGTCNTTADQSVTVTVTSASVAPTAASVDNANYCDDTIPANITLSFSGGSLGSGATAEWYDDAGFTSNVGSGNNLIIAAPNVTTTYYVRFEGACNITTDQNVTVTVDISSIAPVTASVDSPLYCDNAAPANIILSFAGGSLGAGATAEWYDDATFTSNVGSGNNLSIPAPLTSTTYFVRFEGNCNITSGQSILVDVVAPPSSVITGPLAVCNNTTETYSVPAGETSYAWTLTGGDGAISAGANTATVTVDWVLAGGALSVTVVGSAPTNCVSTTAINVNVFSTLPVLVTQSNDFCQNSALPTLVATPEPGATVTWYVGPSATGTLVWTGDTYTPLSTDLDMTTPGTTVFTYKQDIGCLSSSDADYTVNIIAQPNAGTDNAIANCGTSGTIDLFAELGGAPDGGGSWTDDDGSGALTGSIFDPVASGPGTFNFTYQVDGTGVCSAESATAVVTVLVSAGITGVLGEIVNTYPEQDIGSIEVLDIISEDSSIEIRLEDNSGTVIYDWITLDPDRRGEFSYTFTQLPIGDYVVILRDANGCDFQLNQSITLETEVFIPNVITPNGDGYNEFFKILNKSATIEILIVNRWGVKVFESKDYLNDWQGVGLTDGVYYYTIKMSGEVYQGNVEVWRGASSGSN